MKRHLVLLLCAAATALAQAPGRATLGVMIENLDPEDAQDFHIDHGLEVSSVVPNGPAAKAGISEGDIFLSIDGVQIAAFPVLTQMLSTHQPGQTAKVELLREGKNGAVARKTVTVQLGDASALPQQPPKTGAPPASQHGFHPITASAMPRVKPMSNGHCNALAPADWILSAAPDGQSAEIHAGSGAYAGWGIRSVDRSMQAIYGDLYGDPDATNRALLMGMLRENVQYTGPARQMGYWMARPWRTGSRVGMTLHHMYPPAMGTGPGSYILSTYLAWVPASQASLLPVAASTAASIQCVAMPHTSGSSGGKSGTGSKDLDTFNAQLGTQYFHSPSTGETVYVDRNAAWSDTGPDGPGVYRQLPGGGREKLEAGLGN